ncbi:hypothetical protein PVAND_013210 [Polypedilum vanderplanki]|uniref:Uncharacterized protein n=1 Tax=Polypedilum vanderplanki TaxID=319348 RepID=A0A9J6CQU0_POLVA|nr:hypothetical protein PVAND_013210 [Polypedilum vanderplanki]
MKWLIVLPLFIGFIGHYEAHGNKKETTPIASTATLSELYSVEASHEAYRPAKANLPPLNDEAEALSNQKNRFSDIFSSISHEYRDTDDDGDDDNDSGRHKSLINNKPTDVTVSLDDESALNALKFSTTTITLSSAASTSTRHAINSTISNSVIDDGQMMMKMIKNRCNSLIRKGKILEYLQLGDKLVKMDAKSSNSGNGKFQLDVIHDVFSTTTSLLAGIIYKGKVE